MKNKFLSLIVLFIVMTLLGIVYISYIHIPFDETGKYLSSDISAPVVVHEQEKEFFGILFFLSVVVTVVYLFFLEKKYHCKNTQLNSILVFLIFWTLLIFLLKNKYYIDFYSSITS
jgi:hypothetical protein